MPPGFSRFLANRLGDLAWGCGFSALLVPAGRVQPGARRDLGELAPRPAARGRDPRERSGRRAAGQRLLLRRGGIGRRTSRNRRRASAPRSRHGTTHAALRRARARAAQRSHDPCALQRRARTGPDLPRRARSARHARRDRVRPHAGGDVAARDESFCVPSPRPTSRRRLRAQSHARARERDARRQPLTSREHRADRSPSRLAAHIASRSATRSSIAERERTPCGLAVGHCRRIHAQNPMALGGDPDRLIAGTGIEIPALDGDLTASYAQIARTGAFARACDGRATHPRRRAVAAPLRADDVASPESIESCNCARAATLRPCAPQPMPDSPRSWAAPVATKPEEPDAVSRRGDDVELSTDDNVPAPVESEDDEQAAMTTASSATGRQRWSPHRGPHCTKSRRKPRQRTREARVVARASLRPKPRRWKRRRRRRRGTHRRAACLPPRNVVGARHGDRRQRARHAAHAPVPAPPPSRGRSRARAISAAPAASSARSGSITESK